MFTNNGIIPYLAKNDEEMRATNTRHKWAHTNRHY